MVHKVIQFCVDVSVLCMCPLVMGGDESLVVSANYRISIKRFKLFGTVHLNNASRIICECKNI
jgi:hypothetical protein